MFKTRAAIVSLVVAISLGIYLIPRAIYIMPWLLIYSDAWRSPEPATPEVTRGEFPFWIEFELDGEMFLIEDAFIAEFEGFDWNAGRGRHRVWRGWIEGTGTYRMLIPVDESRRLEIVVGRPETYMNDQSFTTHGAPFPQFIMIIYDENSNDSWENLSVEALYEQHGVKIVNYSFSEPIVNSFR